jgi:hypothetical protein
MSNALSAAERVVEEFLIELMIERVMLERGLSTSVQASSTRGLPASPSTARSRPSRPSDEKRIKHMDDLVNAKLISSILHTYILPLRSVVNRDSVPRDFEYALVTAYLLKGIRTVRVDQDKIAMLKFSNFNLSDQKVYNMLSPHKYLTRTKGKNSKIVPHSWTHNLAQSTLLNIMNILNFGQHQEVNACVKLLLSCYHGGYLWLNCRIAVNPTLINLIIGLSMQGTDPQDLYPGKDMDRALTQRIKDTYGDVEKGMRGYKVPSIHSFTVRLTYHMIAGKLVSKNQPTQVTGFIVYLTGKYVEGLQMNWVKYLVNQLELNCIEVQDPGYKFHFS